MRAARAAERVRALVLAHQLMAVAEGMGATLRRAAFSANIKERLDFSCAVFGPKGELLAQAAHIPVHLGAMPAAVRAVLDEPEPWRAGDVRLVNDPFRGGSHLPDLTTVSPVFTEGAGAPRLFLATRAHHADVGGMSPGSLPLAADLHGEGLILPPCHLAREGVPQEDLIRVICANSRSPGERQGDLSAQLAAHRYGEDLLARRLADASEDEALEGRLATLLDGSAALARAVLRRLPAGKYEAEDVLEDDGLGGGPYRVACQVTLGGGRMRVDFAGTDGAVPTGLNAPLAVTTSAASYVLASLCTALAELDAALVNDGLFRPLTVRAPAGCLLNPPPGAAVAAGNVETSQRVVDVILAALRRALPDVIPAASQGTMNNLLVGFDAAAATAGGERMQGRTHYETMAGGAGASAARPGASAIQVHMTNTLNTPVEVLETSLPLRVDELSLRRGSGGAGRMAGGDGLVKAMTFLAPATLTLLTERRLRRPEGAAGGEPGQAGENRLVADDGIEVDLGGKLTRRVAAGDRLIVATPGGGGWGEPDRRRAGP